MQVGGGGHKSSLRVWLTAMSGAKVGIWENLGGCQGQRVGQSEVSVWKRWGEAEAESESSGDWGRGRIQRRKWHNPIRREGKMMWDLPFLFCQHPVAWISSIKHLNFPCHNLFLQPDFLAAGWQREEFTSRFKAAPGRKACSAFYAWQTRFSRLNRWYWFKSDYSSMVIWAFKKYF